MNIKELYESGQDVRDSQIPNKWKESFQKFMFGQTCAIEHKEDGTIDFVYYSHDFLRWYHINQIEIEREEKIDSILK